MTTCTHGVDKDKICPKCNLEVELASRINDLTNRAVKAQVECERLKRRSNEMISIGICLWIAIILFSIGIGIQYGAPIGFIICSCIVFVLAISRMYEFGKESKNDGL